MTLAGARCARRPRLGRRDRRHRVAAQRLAAALGWYRYLRGHVGAGTDIVEHTLSSCLDRRHRCRRGLSVPAAASSAASWPGRAATSTAPTSLLAAAAAQAPTIGDYRHEAIATAFLGHVARERGLLDVARTRHERAGRCSTSSATHAGRPGRGSISAGPSGRPATSNAQRSCCATPSRKFRRIDYHWAAAWTAWALGSIRLAQRDLDNGVALILDGMEAFETASDRRGVASCLESLAVVGGSTSDASLIACSCSSAADQLRTRLLAPLTESEAAVLQRAEQASVDALGEYASESAREEGRAMSIPDVLALARQVGTELLHGADAQPARHVGRRSSPAASARSPSWWPTGAPTSRSAAASASPRARPRRTYATSWASSTSAADPRWRCGW